MFSPVMAASRSPNPEDSYLDFSLTSDSPYSPILETSSPESSSPSPGPVSPGKKRVRISDSTSVRVIEDRNDLSKFKVKEKHNSNSFKPRALRFSSDSGFSDRSEKEALLGSEEYDEEYEDEVYRRECSGSPVEYLEYTEMLCTEDQIVFSDLLYRTESLESRDNPFLPGGDLSKEAEELLKKATIVRDKFFLEQEQEKLLQDTEQPGARPDPVPEFTSDVVDGTLPNASNSSEVVEERICPSAVNQVEAAAPPQPRENGKAGDVSALEASPDKVRLEVGDSPTADGSTAVANDTDAEQQQDKDKPRRRQKCCLLM